MTAATSPPESAAAELPLFPLQTVLLPGGPLQLQIFEPRYVDMVGTCMRSGSPFGVLRIREGSEAGAVAETETIGTSARIIDFHTLENGLLGLLCLGDQIFTLQSQRRQPDGLAVGTVTWAAPLASVPVPLRFGRLAAVLREVLPQLPPAYASIPHHLDDAGWVGFRLLEVLPISVEERQHSLEYHDPLQRLEWLAPMVAKSA